LHSDPKSYASFVALRYNATKAAKLFGLVNSALAPIQEVGSEYGKIAESGKSCLRVEAEKTL
jgi:hypothetical protein